MLYIRCFISISSTKYIPLAMLGLVMPIDVNSVNFSYETTLG